MVHRFIAAVLVCRSEAANAALRAVFEHLALEGVDDSAALAAMRHYWQEHCRPSVARFRDYYDNHYLPERVRETLTLVPDPPSSYLDVGFGDGQVTAELVRWWGLNPQRATGVEIVRPRTYTTSNFLPLVIPGSAEWTIPLPTTSVHLVTLFHVLHHSPVPPGTVLAEVRRVLRPDGCLILREHDVTTPSQQLFLHFVELLFHVVLSGDDEVPWRACQYRSAKKWVEVLNSVGLATNSVVCFWNRRHHLDVDLRCVPRSSRVTPNPPIYDFG
jgi:SAM-dependent methyltransferase